MRRMDPITTALAYSLAGRVIDEILVTRPQQPAFGIVRALPTESFYGDLNRLGDNKATIGDKNYVLSPGLIVRNDMNLIIMPMMAPRSAKVRYTTDMLGMVNRIWVLSAAELRLAEAAADAAESR